jgi:hypothetical protein
MIPPLQRRPAVPAELVPDRPPTTGYREPRRAGRAGRVGGRGWAGVCGGSARSCCGGGRRGGHGWTHARDRGEEGGSSSIVRDGGTGGGWGRADVQGER